MRRRRYTRRSTGQVIQSFKKVINDAPASRASATVIPFIVVQGVDSVAAGQTTATDVQVPTGSVIKAIEFQYTVANLVSIASNHWISIQHLRSGQTRIAPNAVGGNPQRNQVHFQKLFNVGKDQNSNHTIKFLIPKKYQRVREGDSWEFVAYGDTIHTSGIQVIYKFYR